MIGSYLFPIWGLVYRITTWGSPRRPRHMPKPCSTGQKKPCHHCWVSLAKWQSMLELQRAMELNHIHQCWGSGGCPTLTLGQDHIIPDIGACRSPNLLGMKLQQELTGSHQGYICGSPQCRTFKTNSNCITCPIPEGRVTAGGDQWLMVNTFTRVHRDCEAHPWNYRHPPRTSQGIRPQMDSRVHNALCEANSRYDLRLHRYWHDMFYEPSGLGSYTLCEWLLYAHPPGRGGHGFWLGPPFSLTQWWPYALHQKLCIFPLALYWTVLSGVPIQYVYMFGVYIKYFTIYIS